MAWQRFLGAMVCAAMLVGCDDGGGGTTDPAKDAGDAAPPGTDAAPPATDAAPPAADAGPPLDAAPPPGGELRLNEILAAGAGTDWFEVVAVGDQPVDVSTYAVVDARNNRSPRLLPAASLSPGDFLVIAATSQAPADGSPWVDLGLGSGDALTLLRDDDVVDRVDWADGDAPAGTSYGRLPDATGDWQTLRPTPGAPNEPLDGPPPADSPWFTDRVVEVRVELSPDAWREMLAAPLDEAWHPANIVYDGLRAENIAIRTKGNSSLRSVVQSGSDRYSFKVDLNYFDANQALLGVKKLNFNNGFKDPTLMREALAYRLFREFGLPAPRTGWADLWVGDEHMGLYTVVEQVDGAFLSDRFDHDSGVLYKPEAPAGTLEWRGEDPGAYPGLEAERNEDPAHTAFLAMARALDQGTPDDLPAVLDVDLALRYLAVGTLLVNLDSYVGPGHNYYLYEQEGVFTVIPWDSNEAFASFDCRCDRAGLIDFLIDEPVCGSLAARPLAARLLASPALRDQYHQHLRELLDGPFTEAEMGARIAETAAVIRPWVQSDTRKFFTTEEFERGLDTDVRNAIGLRTFMRERVASVRAQLAGERPSTAEGRGNCGGGPGPNPCGDGVCDDHERNNPNLCPQDC